MVLREIAERYCSRSFSNKEVPDEIIKDILEAARLAPSWVNTQPWHFIVVKDKRNKALLSQLAHGQPHVEEASAVIVCCGDKSAWEDENFRKTLESRKGITPERVEALLKTRGFNPKLKGEDAIIYRTLEEITYPVAYMTIEAEKNGVGACVIGWIGNELTESVPEVYELVKNTLNLPDNLIVMALLAVGYKKETQEKLEKIRKSFNEIVSWDFFGNKK
ncbi:MAG: hypothetical protein A2Y25_01965 [Candidatus Melainabacteria bacterium GWF2_37_15]|nr:MAG: hypothetical protein A2Y25_01965 [Candidatus Melainabacteria bacterium GWF2_37_15]